MEQTTFIVALLVIAVLAIASFTLGESTTGPLATPPNPSAEFGVLKERQTFISRAVRSTRSIVAVNDTETSPTMEELLDGALKITRKNARSRDVDNEYIQISYSPRKSGAPDTINLAGWTISNNRGVVLEIPGAAQIAGLTAVPSQDPLIIPKGGKVNIITGRSPVGYNFRENKCTAYFKQFNSFTPALSSSCPRPKDEPGQDGFTDRCFSYVRLLSSCRIPSQLPLDLDNECRSYIAQNVSYSGCLRSHRDDNDFLGNEWWVYLNRPQQLWSDVRETIYLSDPSGTVFAILSYD